jgi:HSP20 family protein
MDVLKRMHEQLNSVFPMTLAGFEDEDSSVVTSTWAPAVDIKEEDERFIIKADVPGVDPKDIDVTMENGVLTLKGERSEEKQEEREGYKRIERSRGSFYRRFSLPDTADGDHIAAKSSNGVLEVVIPKRELAKPRKIQVKS